MEITDEARSVIEAIQRSYYLHADDIAAREHDPQGPETNRQEETIKDREGILELFPFQSKRF